VRKGIQLFWTIVLPVGVWLFDVLFVVVFFLIAAIIKGATYYQLLAQLLLGLIELLMVSAITWL
jgi:hypothetical protein